jgi:excisionase family DNA binding protein
MAEQLYPTFAFGGVRECLERGADRVDCEIIEDVLAALSRDCDTTRAQLAFNQPRHRLCATNKHGDLVFGRASVDRFSDRIAEECRFVLRRYLSTTLADDLLGMSRQYLTRLIDSGEIPCDRIGRHRRLKLKDILEYQARRGQSRRVAEYSRDNPDAQEFYDFWDRVSKDANG